MQQNGKCKSCSERDETINHMISEYRELTQREYKTRHDWVGKVVHWELCKKLKFNYTTKWYMYKSESILVNETRKILLEFKMQPSNHHEKSRLSKKKKKKEKKENLSSTRFCWPAGSAKSHTQSENQRKRKEGQILRPCQRSKNVEHESNGDTNCNWRDWNGTPEDWKKNWKSWKSEDKQW